MKIIARLSIKNTYVILIGFGKPFKFLLPFMKMDYFNLKISNLD